MKIPSRVGKEGFSLQGWVLLVRTNPPRPSSDPPVEGNPFFWRCGAAPGGTGNSHEGPSFSNHVSFLRRNIIEPRALLTHFSTLPCHLGSAAADVAALAEEEDRAILWGGRADLPVPGNTLARNP